MQNLKITLYLESPVILDRYTTIDSILLSNYYSMMIKETGKQLPLDKEHKTVNFIERREGVFSGSVWYIDIKDDVTFDFISIIKNPEYRKMFDLTKKRLANDSLYKQAQIPMEVMNVEKIHFYIRADKKIVVKILQNSLKYIGKKTNLGLGKVSKIKVEEIKEDKGFYIDDEKKLPSKPLDCKIFDVDTSAVAFYRNKPPYWLKEDLTPCYMPSSILIEQFIRKEQNNNYIALKDREYIDNTKFIYENQDKTIKFQEIKYALEKIPKLKHKIIKDNTTLKCSFTNQVEKEGIAVDVKAYFFKTRKRFSDFSYSLNTGFISKEVMWCIQNLKEIGYTLIEEGKPWLYLQGKNAKDGTRLKDYIVEPKKFKPPFSVNLKDSKNAQHVSFKGKVNISNGFLYIQYGNKTLSIDSDTLLRAIEEIKDIVENNPDITKTHLCGNFRDFYHPKLKSNNLEIQNQTTIMEFQKKYATDIRWILSIVAY